MKGITPVVAIILLLLITISLVGFAFVFFTDIIQITSENTENQLQNTLNNQEKRIRIEDAIFSGPNSIMVSVRAIGTVSIPVGEISIYIDNVRQTTTGCWGAGIITIAPQAVETCTLNGFSDCATNNLVRVTAPGGEDAIFCS